MLQQLIIVTHLGIGPALYQTCEKILGQISLQTDCIEVAMDANPEDIYQQIEATIQRAPNHSLLLTDLIGATPANISYRISQQYHCQLLAGINLPMLLKLYNYSPSETHSSYQLAKEGGKKGINSYPNKGNNPTHVS